MTTDHPEINRITTAILLAAGTGSRLHPLTEHSPKCLTEVNGTTILERLIRGLQSNGINRLIIVVGHLDHCIRDFLSDLVDGMTIEYIRSERYSTTNNIYSLWVARHLMQEPFLLIESDLIFDEELLANMLEPNRIAVSRIKPWMNGSTVSINSSNKVTQFHTTTSQTPNRITYKTVNMYSFSLTSWRRVKEMLEQYISNNQVNDYYETVLAKLVENKKISFEAVLFDEQRWDEIDTLDDLHRAKKLFPSDKEYVSAGEIAS